LKLVEFDAASTYAFFRQNSSTTNALTFSIIPRSAVEGLIGSIVGLSRMEYSELLEDSKIAVELMSPVRKLNMHYMHTNPDWSNRVLNRYINNQQFMLQKNRPPMSVPASVEFLISPSYRIYIDITSEKKQVKKKILEVRKNFWTI
jgi:CRISPR-associated protein Cas5h